MSKSDTFENKLLALLFQNANIANIGDATGLRGSTAAGSLFLSLHTADPGEVGTQATSARSATPGTPVRPSCAAVAGFTVTGSTVTLATDQDFPEMTGGTGGTATHFAVGVAASGATVVLYKGPCTPTIAVSSGTIPAPEGPDQRSPRTEAGAAVDGERACSRSTRRPSTPRPPSTSACCRRRRPVSPSRSP